MDCNCLKTFEMDLKMSYENSIKSIVTKVSPLSGKPLYSFKFDLTIHVFESFN